MQQYWYKKEEERKLRDAFAAVGIHHQLKGLPPVCDNLHGLRCAKFFILYAVQIHIIS